MAYLTASVLVLALAAVQATPALQRSEDAGAQQRTTYTCGSTSGLQMTTFTNPSYPAAQTQTLGGCQLRITPLSNNICQLRLDLNEFLLAQPSPHGLCDQDFLQVTGGSSNIPSICGNNDGQHLYVDVSPLFGIITVNIDTAAAGARWSIKVTQIECNSSQRAPAGCLQYYNTTTGTISSFNFSPTNAVATATRQLANQRYGICIKSQLGYCSITYRQATGSTFSLSGDADAGVLAPGLLLPAIVGTGATVGERCLQDYLVIPGGAIINNANVVPAGSTVADRYCGLSFPGVTTTFQPFTVFLATNGAEATDELADYFNQGFKLTYRMNAC